MKILGNVVKDVIGFTIEGLGDYIDYDNVAYYLRHNVVPEAILIDGVADYLKEQYGLYFGLDYDLDFSRFKYSADKYSRFKFGRVTPEDEKMVSNLFVQMHILRYKTFNLLKLKGCEDFTDLRNLTVQDIVVNLQARKFVVASSSTFKEYKISFLGGIKNHNINNNISFHINKIRKNFDCSSYLRKNKFDHQKIKKKYEIYVNTKVNQKIDEYCEKLLEDAKKNNP